jgi:hypothetical protein
MARPDERTASLASGTWTLDRDEFGQPFLVRHRHADALLTGYISREADGIEYGRCASCQAKERLADIAWLAEGGTGGGS